MLQENTASINGTAGKPPDNLIVYLQYSETVIIVIFYIHISFLTSYFPLCASLCTSHEKKDLFGLYQLIKGGNFGLVLLNR